jgi:hypothetical protein
MLMYRYGSGSFLVLLGHFRVALRLGHAILVLLVHVLHQQVVVLISRCARGTGNPKAKNVPAAAKQVENRSCFFMLIG